jgi:TRAP-type mannitol/chloroaromatic compound transport system permease small subunit
VIGILLLKYREEAMTWLTILIGVLFLLSGIISVVAYYSAIRRVGSVEVFDAQGNKIAGGSPAFPIVGAGSIILGLILVLSPHMFINTLMYILAGILILGAINQYVSLTSIRHYAKVPVGFWICPSLVLLAGAVIILRPSWVASAPLAVIGVFMIIYGITECVNSLKIHSEHKKMEYREIAAAEEVSTAEETTSVSEDSNSFGI